MTLLRFRSSSRPAAFCRRCGKRLRGDNRSGWCGPHWRSARRTPRCVIGCGRAQTRFGLCVPCWRRVTAGTPVAELARRYRGLEGAG